MTDRSGTRIMVTGGAGYIGSHLVESLVREGASVRVIERPGADTDHLPDVEVVAADIRDAEAMRRAARGCEVVVHLAANPNLWAREHGEFEGTNHQGTRNVLAAARAADAHRTVYVSTESILTPRRRLEVISESIRTELADMVGPYCRSKWRAEQAAFDAAEEGDPVVIVRPSVPVGPGDHRRGPLTRMMDDFANGRVKGWMPGELNLIDVRDVADGISAAMVDGVPGQAYLLVNENWTIRDFMDFLGEVFHRRPPRVRIPYALALGFAYLEETICRYRPGNQVPMATVTGVKLTRRCFHFDGAASAEALGLAPMRCCRSAIREALATLAALARR